MSVVVKHEHADKYHSQFLGGRSCARVTIPIVSVDQIRAAAAELSALGAELEAVAEDPGSTLAKVLEARALIGRVSTKLKGGIHYRGAR